MTEPASPITGQCAVAFLSERPGIVRPHKKDNTDKLWSYKILGGRKTEFAFDPRTSTTLNIWLDCEPPAFPGLSDIEDVRKKSNSTALTRVFSGGLHLARYKVTIADEAALLRLVEHYASA